MTRRRIGIAVFILLLLAGTTGCRKAKEPPAAVELTVWQVTEKISAAYEGILDYQGTMVMTLDSGNTVFESDLQFKKPRMYREEMISGGDAIGQITVTNGGTLWIYTPQANEVIVLNDLNEGEFITEAGDIKDEILTTTVREIMLADEIALVGTPMVDGKKTYLLEVTPVLGTFLYGEGQVRVWVAADNFLPLQVESLNPDGSTVMTVSFKDMRFNTGLEASRFEFIPPPEATVINVPEQPAGWNEGDGDITEYLSLSEAKAAVDFVVVTPAYLPAGFRAGGIYLEERLGEPVLNIEYSSGSQFIALSLSAGEQPLAGYGEGKPTSIAGAEARLYTDEGISVLVWSKSGTSLVLVGNLSEKELLKIAGSI